MLFPLLSQAQSGEAEERNRLRQTADTQGLVSIIVTFDDAFVPEGRLDKEKKSNSVPATKPGRIKPCETSVSTSVPSTAVPATPRRQCRTPG